MSTVSTALVIVGPSGIGPFHSPEWRVGLTIQLVEGGTNGPYWLSTPGEVLPGVTRPDFLLIDSLKPEDIAKSLCLLLISITTPQLELEELIHNGTLVKNQRGIGFPSPWKFNKDLLKACLKSLAENYKIGIVSLDEFSLLTDETTEILQKNFGISCSKFMPAETLNWS